MYVQLSTLWCHKRQKIGGTKIVSQVTAGLGFFVCSGHLSDSEDSDSLL